MWIGIVIAVVIIVVLMFIISKPTKADNNDRERKVYAMPKQKRYPFFYIKDCHFYADGSSRFAYSDSEIEYLINSQEDASKKGDFGKAVKLADEIIKAMPKSEKIWINKINCIFQDVIQKEKPWEEILSKKIVNACFGFLQCEESVIDRSLTCKHTLVPTLIKNVSQLVKYQSDRISKYHNFEVYNMLINIYHVLPFREILELLSNCLLEDKFDRFFENNEYAQSTIRNFLSYADMLRTGNASRLQEVFDARKITNCTLINDEKIEAIIIAFDLNFEPGNDREKIEARFFDENNCEINFGKKPGDCFIDIFEAKTTRGITVREEIIILSPQRVSKVRVKIHKEQKSTETNIKNVFKKEDTASDKAVQPKENKSSDSNTSNNASKTEQSGEENGTLERKEEKQVKDSGEIKNDDIKVNKPTEETDDKTGNASEEAGENSKEESQEENAEENVKDSKPQVLVYPSFDGIKDIKISNWQFICLKDDGLALSIGEGDYLQQLSTWTDIDKIYVKNNAAYGVRIDGTVIYAGNSEYENSEYVYAWENIDSLYLGDKHMLALTKNATVKAIGNNGEGQCDVDEWYDIIQLAVAFHSVGLTKDGRVLAIGENNFGECDVSAWHDIVQIAAGNFYTVGLTASGKVISTGLNSCGQCNISEWTNIKQIFACGNMTVGLRYDGRVVSTGKTSYRTEDVKNWNRIKKIILSENRIVAIEQDGVVWATGKPYRDFVNGNWQNISDVALSDEHIVGITEDKKLVCNRLLFGHLLSNNLDNIVQICESIEANKIAMLNNQEVLSVKNKDQIVTPEDAYPEIFNVKKADMSFTHLVALKEGGVVSYIKFEDKIVTDVIGWDSIVDVKAGDNFIIGLNIDGHVLADGDNEHGQCNVFNWGDVVKIDAAGNRAVGLTIDGRILIAGKNEFGEADFLKTLEGVKSVVMSKLQTMTLQNDGTVKLSFNPSGVSVESIQNWKGIKKIVARENNFLGLKEDGTVLSTLENEAEISKWKDVEDLDASGSYTWAILKQ